MMSMISSNTFLFMRQALNLKVVCKDLFVEFSTWTVVLYTVTVLPGVVALHFSVLLSYKAFSCWNKCVDYNL